LSIANCRLTRSEIPIGNQKSAIGNVITHPLPRGGTDLVDTEIGNNSKDHLCRSPPSCNLSQTAMNNDTQTKLTLQLFQVGNVDLALRDEEVLAVTDWREPARLPFAPQTVLGVVAIRGRMLTVLDTAQLLDLEASAQDSLVALRGREQLALAGNAQGTIEINPTDIQPATNFGSLSSGTIHKDRRTIHMLATEQLFGSALRGHERRRKRS
jgi:chemotaxis signal transduction protein